MSEDDKARLFDEKLEAYISTTEADIVVLKGQLLIERDLDQLLEAAMPGKSTQIRSLVRRSYYSKLQLANCINLIDDVELQLLVKFNDLRNKVGHGFTHETDQTDIDVLVGICGRLGGYFGTELASISPNDIPERLRMVVLLCVQLLVVREVKVSESISPVNPAAMRGSSLASDMIEIQGALAERYIRLLETST